MPALRRFLKTIPAIEYCYGQYKLQRCRRAYRPEYVRLLDTAPAGIRPLSLANSLNQFEWLVSHRLFPAGLIERLVPPGPGRAIDRAFANFALGYQAEQQVAAEWQRTETISEAAERRLTEFLNRYITYALRTFGVHLEMHGNPQSTDAIRLRRVLGELEGEEGDLLDIGCAFAPLAERYARMRRWVGLDLSLPALAIGRIIHAVPAESLVCAYSEELPFPNAAFDVVVSSEVLEHTPKPLRMVQEIARVLRSGGKAVLTVPMHIVDYQNGRQHLIGPTDSTHRFQFHSLDELRSLFEQHGLTVERLQSNPHYVFTLRRVTADEIDGAAMNEEVSSPHHLITSSPHHHLACPDCQRPLVEAASGLHCGACGTVFERRGGVPVLLPRRLRGARLDLVT